MGFIRKARKLVRNPIGFFDDSKLVTTVKRSGDIKNLEKKTSNKEGVGSTEAHSKTPAFAFHVGEKWQQAIRSMLPEYDITFARIYSKNEDVDRGLLKQIEAKFSIGGGVFLVWGYLGPKWLKKISRKNNISIHRFEDGFLRSVGVGSELTSNNEVNLPCSITLDKQSIYYDAFSKSDIEDILNYYPFKKNPKLIARSKGAIRKIVDNKLTKYNTTVTKDINQIYGEKKGKRVLVIGQVETDASIKYGCDRAILNNDLVRLAFNENKGAQIIYKPHPVVLKGARESISNPVHVARYCQIITEDLDLPSALDTIDHVYVITSGAGFEALMRGIKVTCLGANFYSGWGITDDRLVVDRRVKKLSLEEVFAAFYILYTRYYDHDKNIAISLEQAIDLLIEKKSHEKGIEFFNRSKTSMEAGLYYKSYSEVSKAVALNENNPVWNYHAALVLSKTNQYSEAIPYLDKAISIYPYDGDWYSLRAGAKYELGELDTNLELDYMKSFELSNGGSRAVLNLLRYLRFTGRDYNWLLPLVREKASKAKVQSELMFELAAAELDRGCISDAMHIFSKARERDPQTAHKYIKLSAYFSHSSIEDECWQEKLVDIIENRKRIDSAVIQKIDACGDSEKKIVVDTIDGEEYVFLNGESKNVQVILEGDLNQPKHDLLSVYVKLMQNSDDYLIIISNKIFSDLVGSYKSRPTRHQLLSFYFYSEGLGVEYKYSLAKSQITKQEYVSA